MQNKLFCHVVGWTDFQNWISFQNIWVGNTRFVSKNRFFDVDCGNREKSNLFHNFYEKNGKNDFYAKFDFSSLDVNGIRFFSKILKNCSWENAKQLSFWNFFQNWIISITSWVMPSWNVANEMNHTVVFF